MAERKEVPKVIWARPERRGRGPAPSLRREDIAKEAVKIADADGIEAVSMRSLAAALGVGATSLYRYVESKEEVIDLMVDHTFGVDFHFEASGDPRPSIEARYGSREAWAERLAAATARKWAIVSRGAAG